MPLGSSVYLKKTQRVTEENLQSNNYLRSTWITLFHKGIFLMCRGGGVQWESKSAYGVHNIFEDRLSRGSFSTVRATVVGWDAVLAGDPKCLDYYVILI